MATEPVDVIVDVEKEKERQRLEVEVLQSIYNDEEFTWYTDDNGWICIQFYAFLLLTKDFSITFHQDTCSDDGDSDSSKDEEQKEEEEEAVIVKHLPPLELTAALPPDYPSKSSPQFSLSCSWLTADMLTRLCKQFDTIWEENRSSEILYTWTEFLKEDTLRFFSLDDNNNLVVNKSCLKNDFASLNKRQQATVTKKTPAKVQQPTVKSVKSENNLNSEVGDQNDKRSDNCSDDSTWPKDKNLSLEDESVNKKIAVVSGVEKDDGDKHVPASTDASTSSAPTINCTNGSSGVCSHKTNTNKMFQTRLFYNNYGNSHHQKFNKRKFNRHQNYNDNYSHFYNHNNNSHQKNYRKRNSYNNFNCDNHQSSSTTVGTDKSCDNDDGGDTQAVATVPEEKKNKQPLYKYRHYNRRKPHSHDNNYNTRNRKADRFYDKSNDVCFVGIADHDAENGDRNKPYENDSDVCNQPSMSTYSQSDVSKICHLLSVSTVSEDKKSDDVHEGDNGGNLLSELSSKSVSCEVDDDKVASKQSVIMADKNNDTICEDACTLSQCVALLVNKNSGEKDKRVKKNVSQYSVNNLVNYLRSYNEERIVNEFNKSYYCCTICFQDKMGHLCTQFKPCGHVFCKLCIGQYVKVKIDERAVFVIKCPQDSCDSDVTPSQVRDLVGPDLFAKYDGILLTTTLETMTDITLCPRSACQYPVSQEPDEKMAVCPSCHYVFCVYCKMVYHGIEPCRFRSDEKAALVKQYLEGDEQVKRLMEQRYGRKQLNTLIEASLSETWISNNSHNCPHCNASIEKSGGCNKMVCWRCSTFFCWICQARLDPSNPYKHYSDPVSRCHNQLFEGIPDDDDDDDENDGNGFIFYEEVGEDDYLIEYEDDNFIIDDELAAI